MGSILQNLGFSVLQTPDESAFSIALPSSRIAFLNCGGAHPRPIIIQGIKKCLQGGGVVFASDWAADCLDALAVQGLQFHPRGGASTVVDAELVDQELRSAIGRDCVELTFDLGGWIPVKTLPGCARVLLRGNVDLAGFLSGQVLAQRVPLAFSVPVDAGQIFFTSFHNHSQITDLERGLLSFLAIKTIATATGQTMRQVITERRLTERLRL